MITRMRDCVGFCRALAFTEAKIALSHLIRVTTVQTSALTFKLMQKFKSAATLAAFSALILAGCGKSREADNPTMTSTRTAPAPPVMKPAPPDSAADGTAATQAERIKKEVEAALQSNPNGVFPKGVKINRVEIKEGVTSLDFNSAFNQVANLGESGESDAQKELMRTVAGCGVAQKMRVTVEGRPFDSQATDWSTPFSVKPTANDNKSADAKAGQ